jgi:predicted dehydrogenase
MRYSKGTLVHLHLSWLDPLKVRNTVVVGTKQMVVCDSLTKKIEIYNTSIDVHDEEEIGNKSYADHLLSYKYGDIVIPFIDNVEPMQAEAEEFIKCMETGDTPLASGEVGLSVVQTVGGMKESLRRNGQWVEV